MDSAKHIPLLYEGDTLILGSTAFAVDRALALAQEGQQVILAARETFLGSDVCCRLAYPQGVTPDAYKKGLEARCQAAGVKLIYMAWYLDTQGDISRLGGKFGVAAVRAPQVEDFRVDYDDSSFRAFLQKGEQTLLLEVAVPEGKDPLLAARLEIIRKFRETGLPGDSSLGRFSVRGGNIRPIVPYEKTVSRKVRSLVDDFRTKRYPTLTVDAPIRGQLRRFDLVVAGAGTAGAMAALAAARGGATVALVEPNFAPGGTSTLGGVSAYWFGSRYRDVREIDQQVARLAGGEAPGLWGNVDSWNPDIKATALLQLLLDAGVDIFFGHTAFGVIDGGIAAASDRGVLFLEGNLLLDATGDADLAVFAGAQSCYGSPRDRITYWASLAQYPTAHTYRNNFSAMMVSCDPLDHTAFILKARHFGGDLFDHGAAAAPRETRHIRGRTTLTLKDLMTHTRHSDTLYTCYSNYDPKGKVTGDILYCGQLPQQNRIAIPLGALLPVDGQGRKIPGMLVLGKAISASHDIFPSIRMQPDLMHQGFCAGTLAAACLKTGRDPWDLTGKDIRAILAPVTDDPLEAPAEGCLSLADCVKKLDHTTRTHWVDMDFTDCETRFQILPALFYADSQAVLPLLRRELEARTDPRDRAVLIRLLLWHGDDSHLSEHLSNIAAQLAGDTLPARKGATTCAQLLPDHGVMPEVVYDLNLLAYAGGKGIAAPFKRVYDLLTAHLRDYLAVEKGIFPYIESFAFVAERNHSPALPDLIRKLLQLPELQTAETLPDSDLMKQRFLLLRFLLHRALALNGQADGFQAIAETLRSPYAPLWASAWQCLADLTGEDLGYTCEKWLNWAKNHPISPQLIKQRFD